MRSLFLRLVFVSGVLSLGASALSLYDAAPLVGLPESSVAHYSVSTQVGYDTNPQGTTYKPAQSESMYVSANVSTRYAEYESVDRLSYHARLGGTRYFGNRGGGEGRRYYADCALVAELSHAFSAMSRYTGSVRVTYSPEPSYDDAISRQSRSGDTLSWTLDNGYHQAIDSRWSWNVSGTYSGTEYSGERGRYDNRQYLSAGGGLQYRDSDLLTYTSSISYREELREYGLNSRSAFVSVGFQRSLDPMSSCSFSVGVQGKTIGGSVQANPTLNAAYRRVVTEGLSVNWYLAFSNENIDSYDRYSNGSYRDCAAWRSGATARYTLSPDVQFTFGFQTMLTQYSDSTNRALKDATKYTIMPNVGMRYRFTPHLVGNIGSEYTYYRYDRERRTSYTRVRVYSGLTYEF
ncbi:MAG: hypothetical protein ACI4PZ_05670 [Akkermansia sp.]